MKPEMIRQRFDALRSERKTIESVWQDVERYVCPFRGEFFQDMTSEHEQRYRRPEHYDSTALYAAKALKSHIHGMLVSPATKWFGLRYRTDMLNEDQEAMEWLETCEDIVYQSLVQSNFNIQTAEFLYDMVTYGIGFIVEELEDEVNWKGLDFKAVGVREAFFETDHKGNLVNFYRRLQWSPLQCYEKWGDDCPEDIIEKAKTPAGIDTSVEIIFCIYKRMDAPEQQPVMPANKRQYGMKYVRHSDSSMIGDEGGYYEMPAFHAIWDSVSASKFGVSPAMDCLADVKNVNVFLRDMREQSAMATCPPQITNDRNVYGDLNMKARGLTTVKDITKIRELVTQARFDVGAQTMMDFRASIERAFLMDSLQLKDSPAMTATEVQARYDLMMRNISHTLGSLQTNFLDPAVTRSMNILYRAGRLPKMPDIVRESMDEFDITYTGPMPRAQKRDDVMSTRAWLQDTAGLAEVLINAQMEPTVLDIPDFDKIERDLGLQAGVPAKYMKGEEEVMQERQIRQQAREKAQKMAELEQAGNAMTSVAQGTDAVNQVPEAAQAIAGVSG